VAKIEFASMGEKIKIEIYGIDQVCCPWMAKTKSNCLKNNNKKRKKKKKKKRMKV